MDLETLGVVPEASTPQFILNRGEFNYEVPVTLADGTVDAVIVQGGARVRLPLGARANAVFVRARSHHLTLV